MKKGWIILMTILSACGKQPQTADVDVFLTTANGLGQQIGYVKFIDTDKGLEVNVDLKGLPEGEHGFHIHENASCAPMIDKSGVMQPALAAGGHYDPEHTGKHMGPDANGHKGDMPALMVDANGNVNTTFYLQNLRVEEVKNHSVIIHAGGDNYSDEPLPLGGGGARIACGIIK